MPSTRERIPLVQKARLTASLLVVFVTSTVSITALFGCSVLIPGTSGTYSKHLKSAESLERQGKYGEAISAYRQHIQERCEDEERAEWENPSFYLLIIGDILLKQGKVTEALHEYEQAQLEEVAVALISDRFRLIANWLADRERKEEAISILSIHRETDPVLFDLMRDRIARELVAGEEASLRCSNDSTSIVIGEKCPRDIGQ